MTTNSHEAAQELRTTQRVGLFDVVRGFSVASMVLFHLCYDLRYVYGIGATWFRPPLQDVWRASISWVFLFVAGCMCSYSRNNLRRALRYLAVAFIVWLATSLVRVDTPISFGIIFCMGASTLIQWGLDRLGIAPKGLAQAALLIAAFLVLRGLPHGFVGMSPELSVVVPRSWYHTPFFSWLGLPGPGFASGDYYPVLPFALMFLAGSSVMRTWAKKGLPSRLTQLHAAPLEFLGRHALPLYVLHQPLIIGAIELYLLMRR